MTGAVSPTTVSTNGYPRIRADGIILGSPTYFADVTAEMKVLSTGWAT
jgi:hypothetical protein